MDGEADDVMGSGTKRRMAEWLVVIVVARVVWSDKFARQHVSFDRRG
jgi:hypothetical protein